MIFGYPLGTDKNGSKVSIFGFSRGAYAARILAGILTSVCWTPFVFWLEFK